MEVKIFDRFLQSLTEARSNLGTWLQGAPQQKKETRLGPADDRAVQQHLKVIDTYIEQAQANTLGLCQVCHGFVDEELLEMDHTASICLDHYSEEERRQLEYELELAQSVQRTLLPQRVPDIPGLEVATYCSAGHNHPLVLRHEKAEKASIWLEPTGPALGWSRSSVT